ncbi:MAG: hypothetical protein ACI4AW_00050 [Paludibacteraceae bacterium]
MFYHTTRQQPPEHTVCRSCGESRSVRPDRG